jgi:hypothetical protein
MMCTSRLGVRAIAVALAACGAPQPTIQANEGAPPGATVRAEGAPSGGATVQAEGAPSGRTASGATIRLEIAGEWITGVAPSGSASWLWPPMIDSHVHLAYWSVADRLVKSGVAAVVDLAAPETTLDEAAPGGPTPLHVLEAGPMLTRERGYPLASWGKAGYGVGCSDTAAVTAAIDRLASHGARVIKLALDDRGLPLELVPAAVTAAHARKLKVAVHAMSDASVAAAARAGADLLAHTPAEPLGDATIALWRGRAVISTLAAFGGSDVLVDNLRKLRAAGATVLYGTDLGTARVAGPNPEEVALLRKAGLDDAAIADAMTTAPAAYWGLPFGLAKGAEATFVVLDGDPRRDVAMLLAPREAWLRGRRVR